MLYRGIDQHARQTTIYLRDDGGDGMLVRRESLGGALKWYERKAA